MMRAILCALLPFLCFVTLGLLLMLSSVALWTGKLAREIASAELERRSH